MNETNEDARQQEPEDRKVDPLAEISRSIEHGIAVALRDLVEGTATDIARFGTGIAQSMLLLSSQPGGLNTSRLAELKAQLGMLAAMNGIRARRNADDVMRQALATAVDVLGPVIGAALRLIVRVP